MSSTPYELFCLVDCNNFYASCERVFDPSLENQPVLVLSNNDGCVVARSQEVKQMGIKMGVPFFQIAELCKREKVAVFSSNYELYGDLSQRVMSILELMADKIQIYSIDEAFLNYPASTKNLFEHCLEVRQKVRQWVGIPTSIGIAPTKTLAKVASWLAKKNPTQGVFDLTSTQVQEKVLKEFPVENLWGVGMNLKLKLNAIGIYTAWEFKKQDPFFIRKKMGIAGQRILWELRGISCLPLSEADLPKSMICSRSFGGAITELAELEQALSTYVNSASVKLREKKCSAKAMQVFLEPCIDSKTGFRPHFSCGISFALPTSDTPQLISAAKGCLSKLFRNGERYRKCGVILLDLASAANVHPDLFLDLLHPKRLKLAETVDRINDRFGRGTLFYGAMGVAAGWKMRCERCSRRYTRCWEELAVAQCN